MGIRYKYVLEGESFQKLSSKEIAEIKQKHNARNSPKGISYPKKYPNVVVLTSHSQHDILDCIENQVLWEHSSKPTRAKEGDTIYVLPNVDLQNRFGAAAVGVKFKLNKKVYEVDSNKIEWTSDLKDK